MEVRRKSDKVMAIILTFGEEVVRVFFAYGQQSVKPIVKN